MHPSTDTAIAKWLAESRDSPRDAWEEWSKGPYTLLPMGRRFDVVRICAELVHAAAGSVEHTEITAGLVSLRGPVIGDGRWYYALVPPGTTETWTVGLTRCLGRGSWLVIPHPELTGHTRTHWCVPMEDPGRLCDVRETANLVTAAHLRLATPAGDR